MPFRPNNKTPNRDSKLVQIDFARRFEFLLSVLTHCLCSGIERGRRRCGEVSGNAAAINGAAKDGNMFRNGQTRGKAGTLARYGPNELRHCPRAGYDLELDRPGEPGGAAHIGWSPNAFRFSLSIHFQFNPLSVFSFQHFTFYHPRHPPPLPGSQERHRRLRPWHLSHARAVSAILAKLGHRECSMTSVVAAGSPLLCLLGGQPPPGQGRAP